MPQVSPVPRTPGLTQHAAAGLIEAVREAFSPTGALARVVEGYEPRDGQRRMAEAVAGVIDAGGILMAEAGTGTGKTLAYLIPGILSRQRLLISTGTKNLQEQIFFKDLPALRDALGIPFTATLMKGRANYLCLHRFELYRQAAGGVDPVLPIVEEWARKTTTGDRAELCGLPEHLPLWKEVAADADTCLGSECPRYGDCFVTGMRQRAAESDVVIVNHHLLCADASVRQSAYGEVIPSCATLVVDEAHQLEDVATQYFGYAFSSFRVDDLLRDAERLQPLLWSAPGHDAGQAVTRALARVADCAFTFFGALIEARAVWGGRGGGDQRLRYTADSILDHADAGMNLEGALEALEAALTPGQAAGSPRPPEIPADSGEQDEAVAALRRRAGELRRDLRFLIRASDPDFVYFLEGRGKGLFLRASPVDVSRIVREALFDRLRTAVLTSATLAVEGSFDYVKGRLGVVADAQLRVPSEFDYATQALLYLPRRMPSPKAPGFAEAAGHEVVEILKRTRGRAFVLFTSYAVLRTVQGFVEMALPYPVLVQGTAPRTELVDRFRSTPNAVLLATSSFWQGVDVVGDALSCVIIDRLPFASPADPVTAARIDAIRTAGGDAFADYQVPLAILTLQQGLGRLIRHRTDRGVLAMLDPRLRTTGYGRRFLDSMPPAPVTHDLTAVERFFG